MASTVWSPSASTRSILLDLPNDVLLLIFSYIPFRARVFLLPRLCERFHKLVPISVTSLPKDFPGRLVPEALRRWPKIASLTVLFHGDVLAAVRTSATSLRSLDLRIPKGYTLAEHNHDCNPPSSCTPLSAITGLTSLRLRITRHCASVVVLLANNISSLTSLSLEYLPFQCDWLAVAAAQHSLSLLTSLSICLIGSNSVYAPAAPYVTAAKMSALPEKCLPALRSLRVDDASAATKGYLKQYTPLLSRLMVRSPSTANTIDEFGPVLSCVALQQHVLLPRLIQCTNLTSLIARSPQLSVASFTALHTENVSVFAVPEIRLFTQLQSIGFGLQLDFDIARNAAFPLFNCKFVNLTRVSVWFTDPTSHRWVHVLSFCLNNFEALTWLEFIMGARLWSIESEREMFAAAEPLLLSAQQRKLRFLRIRILNPVRIISAALRRLSRQLMWLDLQVQDD